MQLLRLALVDLLLLLAPAVAQGTTVAITARSDATLYEDPTGTTANGSGSYLFAGKTAAGIVHRALVDFDVAGNVPAGARIVAVELHLNVSRSQWIDPLPVAAHRVLASWTEGPSNAPFNEGPGTTALAGDVTWLHRTYPNVFWSTPGGDFAPAPSGVGLTPLSGAATWPAAAGMVADVQGWLDAPATNFGWLLKTDEFAGLQIRRFDARTATVAANRPTLVVTYVLPGQWADAGRGCGSPAPVLGVLGTLQPGGSLTFAYSGGPAWAPAACFFALALQQPAIGLAPGCGFHLPLPSATPGLTLLGPTGGVQYTFPIPALPAFSGQVMTGQGMQVDGVTSSGFSMTNAVFALVQ